MYRRMSTTSRVPCNLSPAVGVCPKHTGPAARSFRSRTDQTTWDPMNLQPGAATRAPRRQNRATIVFAGATGHSGPCPRGLREAHPIRKSSGLCHGPIGPRHHGTSKIGVCRPRPRTSRGRSRRTLCAGSMESPHPAVVIGRELMDSLVRNAYQKRYVATGELKLR